MAARSPLLDQLRKEKLTLLMENQEQLGFASDRPGGYGKADFYISFRNGTTWSDPVNMGSKFNTTENEYIPYVSPDEKYFFFTSSITGNREIYWVDAKIIKSFRKPPTEGETPGKVWATCTTSLLLPGYVAISTAESV